MQPGARPCSALKTIKMTIAMTYVITYVTTAVKLSDTKIASLNTCWNSVFRYLIFHFNRWESVTAVICGLDQRDFRHLHLTLATALILHYKYVVYTKVKYYLTFSVRECINS